MLRRLAVVLSGSLFLQAPTLAPQRSVEEDLAAGIRQVDEGDLEAAVVTLDTVVQRLKTEKGREKDLATAHLYLAMTHLGLSQWERAKGEMREAWRNNREMTLDPKKFPPRVIQLYDEAKREAGAAESEPPKIAAKAAPAKPVPVAAVEGDKKGGSKTMLIVLGAGGAAAAGVALAAGGGGSAAPTPIPPATLPARRTDTFAFTLAAGSPCCVVVGPVFARNGALEVTLSFSGDFIILACVGPGSQAGSTCTPMGGRPQTRTFNIPSDFPAGRIQASVYFNYYYSQPPGDAR